MSKIKIDFEKAHNSVAILKPKTLTKLSLNLRYKSIVEKKLLIIIGLFIILTLSFCLNISKGAANLSLSEVCYTLIHRKSVATKICTIVWIVRLPVAIMAVLVGAGLAVAGMEMQTILNNSLASPYTLGVSSAASFGAALSLVLGHSILSKNLQNFAMPIFAFVFALSSSFLIYTVGKMKKERSSIILAGIAMNFLFTALNSVFTYFVPDDVLRGIINWSHGSLIGATIIEDLIVFFVLLICIPVLLGESWKLTSLNMGEGTAKALGVDVDRLRTKILILASLITSISVCFVGTIGFIGLVSPYIAKRLVGEDQRYYIPATIMTGSIFLSAASVLSRATMFGVNFPLTFIVNIIGIPFLILLIIKKKG